MTEERRRDNDRKIDEICEKLDQIKSDLSDNNTNLALLASKVEANHKSVRESIERNYSLTDKHEHTLYGNGTRTGLTAKMQEIDTLSKEVNSHVVQDRWMFGIVITLLVFVLGKMFVQ